MTPGSKLAHVMPNAAEMSCPHWAPPTLQICEQNKCCCLRLLCFAWSVVCPSDQSRGQPYPSTWSHVIHKPEQDSQAHFILSLPSKKISEALLLNSSVFPWQLCTLMQDSFLGFCQNMPNSAFMLGGTRKVHVITGSQFSQRLLSWN